VAPNEGMVETITAIMVEMLNFIGIATKEIKQGRTSKHFFYKYVPADNAISEKYLKTLMGKNDIEDVLKRLDRLTQEEARMAAAQLLKVTNTIDNRVGGIADTMVVVDNRVVGVDERVAGVDERVAGVGERVAGVDERVAGVGERVAGVDERVAGVDERVAGVDERVAGIDDRLACVNDRVKEVDDRVKAVDDKVAAVDDGARYIFCLSS
jgi:archaellum component FlaC